MGNNDPSIAMGGGKEGGDFIRKEFDTNYICAQYGICISQKRALWNASEKGFVFLGHPWWLMSVVIGQITTRVVEVFRQVTGICIFFGSYKYYEIL